MSEIRFYDYDMRLVAVEPRCVSSNWTIYYNGIGTFEARLDPLGSVFEELADMKYLIAEEDGRQAVITAKQAGADFAVYGRTPEWFLSKRIVLPFSAARLFEKGLIETKNPEKLVRYLISQAFGEDDGNFLLDAELGGFSEADFEKTFCCKLSEAVEECLEAAGAGHRLRYDFQRGRWVFSVTRGAERELIVGEAQSNTRSSSYTEDALDYANGAVFEKAYRELGDWSAADNIPAVTNGAAENYGGRYRVSDGGTRFGITFEKGDYLVFPTVDGMAEKGSGGGYFCTILPDDEAAGLCKWYAALNAGTDEEAAARLAENKWIKRVEAESAGLVSGRDYELGDVLRTQKKIGSGYITGKRRVVGTEFYKENGISGEKIIFGEE